MHAGGGAPTSVMVNVPGATSETVRLPPSVAGSNVVPVSVWYGWRTIDVTNGSVVVALITSRCFVVRYSVLVSVTVVGVFAVAVTVTVLAGDVPWLLAAFTVKV